MLIVFNISGKVKVLRFNSKTNYFKKGFLVWLVYSFLWDFTMPIDKSYSKVAKLIQILGSFYLFYLFIYVFILK